VRRPLKPPRLGEILAGASGTVLLVSLFLPWYREKSEICPPAGGGDCPDPQSAGSAWAAFSALDVFLLVAALAAIGLLALELTQRTPAIPIAWAAVTAPVGLAATVWVFVRTLNPPDTEVEPLFALLGLLAAAGVTAGCALSMRDEGFGLRPKPGIDATRRRGSGDGGPEPIRVGSPAGEAPRGGER
jgi:hypothetical protein